MRLLEPGGVAGQQRQVEAGIAAAAGLALGALAGGDVGLVAEDRIEAGCGAFAVELDGAVQVAVIGQGQGVHAQFLGVRDQLGDAAGAVEQAVMAVAVQMNERDVPAWHSRQSGAISTRDDCTARALRGLLDPLTLRASTDAAISGSIVERIRLGDGRGDSGPAASARPGRAASRRS